jgi:hypothetical protein
MSVSSWQQAGFRDLFGLPPNTTEMCNYITTNAISGFNALNGFQNQKERDFYNGCKAWFTEVGYGQTDSNSDNPNNNVEPTPTKPNSDSDDEMPSYWVPTVENMILCAEDRETCEGWNHPVSNGNTFGENAARVAQRLVDSGLCSDINRYDETSHKNTSQCYIDEQGNRLRVITSDTELQLLLAHQLNYERKVVLKDGLVVFVSTTDRTDLIDQIGEEIGGQVVAIG